MSVKVFYQRLNKTRDIDSAMFIANFTRVDGVMTVRENPDDLIALTMSLMATPVNYLPVAVLNTSCLETTFQNTQNDEDSWYEADIVDEFLFDGSRHIYQAEGKRSSMVGDIFVVDGKDAYVVARQGFVKLYDNVAAMLEGQI